MKTTVPWMRAFTVLALVLCMATPAMATYSSTLMYLDSFPEWVDGTTGADRNYTQFVAANASASHAKAGDLGMAVAKVVRWWQFPSKGTGTVAYTDARNETTYSIDLTAAATGRPYVFSTMPVTLGSTSTAAINQTVARLISDAAYAVETRFYGNSTADLGTGEYLSTNFMLTTPTAVSGSSSSYADCEAWMNVFKSELSSNYTGRGKGAPSIIRLTPYSSNQSDWTQYNGSYVAVVTGWRETAGGDGMVQLNFADGTVRWTTLDNDTSSSSIAGAWAIAKYGYGNQTALTGFRPIYSEFYPISPAADEEIWWDEGPFVFGDAGGRGCRWYQLELTNGTTTNTKTWGNSSEDCSNGICTIYADQYAVSAPGNWSWAISAWCLNDTTSTNWYQVNPNFDGSTSYNAQAPDDAVLVSPSGTLGSTQTAPSFVWNFTRGITWYNVRVYDYNTAKIIDAWFSNSSVCNAAQTSCTATWEALKEASSLSNEPEDFPSGSFTWDVGGWGIGSADYVSIGGYNPGDVPRNVQDITAGPTANNGTEYVASAFPAITWNRSTPGSGAAWYDLWVGTPASGSSWREQWIGTPQAYCNSTFCTYKHWIPQNGEYQVWFNYWYNNSGDWQQSGWSNGNFSAYPGPPSGVGISAPVEGSQIVGFQPNFKWNIDQNASWQGIYLEKSGSVVDCSPANVCSSGQYWMETGAFNDSYAYANSSKFQSAGLSGGTYTWKIAAWGSGNASGVPVFTMGTFSVTSQGSATPNATAPSNGSSQSGDVTFTWGGGNSTWYGVTWSGAASGSYWLSENDACGGVSGTTCTVTVKSGNFTASGNYTWYISGWGPNDADVVNSASRIFSR